MSRSMEDKAGRQFFVLLSEYFRDGWSNSNIRELNKDGVEIKVDDLNALKSETFRFPVSVLTDAFLVDARALFQSIEVSESSKG